MSYKRDINLMPEEQKDPKIHLVTTVIFYILAIGIILGVAGIYLPDAYLQSKIAERDRLAKQEKELEDLINEYDQLEARSLQLSARKKAFEALDSGYIKINNILEDFEKALPESVTIVDLSINQKELRFKATSASNTDIAQLYINLLRSRYFSNVILTTINEEDEGVKEFPVNVTIELKDELAEPGNENGGQEAGDGQ